MEKEIRLSNQTVCKLCRYRLSEACETCLNDEQYSWFEARRNLTLGDLPPFTSQEFNNGMPVKARQIIMGVYMETVIRTLKEGI